MASLGTFEAAVREYEPPADPDTFELCGETFTVRGAIPGMLHLTVGASLSGKIRGVDAAAAMWEALRYALTVPAGKSGDEDVPEDDSEWQRFYQLTVDRRVETETIAEIAYQLLGAEVGRPTGQQSGS